MSSKQKLTAYCESNKCNPDLIGKSNPFSRKIKHVSINKINCPDCNHVLVWRSSNSKKILQKRKGVTPAKLKSYWGEND